MILTWEKLRPFVEAQRATYAPTGADPQRWQIYYENLYLLIQETPPVEARSSERNWRVRESNRATP
ncbi:hypothetical protein GCM10012280_34830 [Wenjunlia tyrosinilytica]|uniref:Uncharacterized protein n=1 Tax=Wenjunlia tyrosinilytica TaxID=1544741 RepID=A0A918DZ17_9ACTN|nr:hypothetical protein GCM10012280_34830 [Wenjunlia tyrosinilytica]